MTPAAPAAQSALADTAVLAAQLAPVAQPVPVVLPAAQSALAGRAALAGKAARLVARCLAEDAPVVPGHRWPTRRPQLWNPGSAVPCAEAVRQRRGRPGAHDATCADGTA